MADRKSQHLEVQPNELTEQELDKVAAGITVTKHVDAASPSLFMACATGKHIDSGTTH